MSAAESNCLAAVANQTGVGDVSTITVDYAESGIGVSVAVPGTEAPWHCVVDTDGLSTVVCGAMCYAQPLVYIQES